ncbi:unnamed protein product [Anisakis simplex]|uniref:Calponin-homology (CH) domain-containing protein n=1 Tax=Anisakis simplex TaxID=6269 RepID=A0A0M3K286_ANISI|nr:unnamed protein product [Anisakis simplex]
MDVAVGLLGAGVDVHPFVRISSELVFREETEPSKFFNYEEGGEPVWLTRTDLRRLENAVNMRLLEWLESDQNKLKCAIDKHGFNIQEQIDYRSKPILQCAVALKNITVMELKGKEMLPAICFNENRQVCKLLAEKLFEHLKKSQSEFESTAEFKDKFMIRDEHVPKENTTSVPSVSVEYDGKKLELLVRQQAGIQLFEHWTQQALAAFIASYANEKSKHLNYFRRNEYDSCIRDASSTLKDLAKCAKGVVDSRKTPSFKNNLTMKKIDGQSSEIDQSSSISSKDSESSNTFTEKSQSKSMKYLKKSKHNDEKILVEFNNTTLSEDALDESANNSTTTINSDSSDFDLIDSMEDEEQSAEKNIEKLHEVKKRVKGSKMEILQKLNMRRRIAPINVHKADKFNRMLPGKQKHNDEKEMGDQLRLVRNKRKVVSKSEYELLNEDAGRTPLGVLARSLRNLIHEVKGMASKDLNVAEKITKETTNRTEEMLTNEERQAEESLSEALVIPFEIISEALKLGLVAAEHSNATDGDNGDDSGSLAREIASDFVEISTANNTDVQQIVRNHNICWRVDCKRSPPDLPSFLSNRPTATMDQHELLKLLAEVSSIPGIGQKHKKTNELKKTEEQSESNGTETAEKRECAMCIEELGLRGQPLYFTKQNISIGGRMERIVGLFQKLHTITGNEQIEQLNTLGYSTLTKLQVKLVYGSNSPFQSREAFQRYVNADAQHLQRYVERDLELIAEAQQITLANENSPEDWLAQGIVPQLKVRSPKGDREEDQMKRLYILSRIILSPIAMMPSVVGPYLLNPWLFSPLLTSAIVNVPFILHPQRFPALPFSPLIYRPNILVLGVVDTSYDPSKRFSAQVIPLDSLPSTMLSQLIVNPDLFVSSVSLKNETQPDVFTNQTVNLTPQFIYSLMFPNKLNGPSSLKSSSLMPTTSTPSSFIVSDDD